MRMETNTIGDIASRVATPSLQGKTSVFAAVEVMDLYNVDIIGVECDDFFVGVFGRNDLKRLVLQRHLSPQHTLLQEVATLNTPSVPWHYSPKETYNAMLAYQWHYMPVLCGSRLCGIVSLKQLEDMLDLPSFASPPSGGDMTGNAAASASYI